MAAQADAGFCKGWGVRGRDWCYKGSCAPHSQPHTRAGRPGSGSSIQGLFNVPKAGKNSPPHPLHHHLIYLLLSLLSWGRVQLQCHSSRAAQRLGSAGDSRNSGSRQANRWVPPYPLKLPDYCGALGWPRQGGRTHLLLLTLSQDEFSLRAAWQKQPWRSPCPAGQWGQ